LGFFQEALMSAMGFVQPVDGAIPYNLFRRRSAPDLFCAVAQAHPVPGFIEGDEWEFVGSATDERDAPQGFQAKEARFGARLNGFYLFLARSMGQARNRQAA
jgi:hypothetical protein